MKIYFVDEDVDARETFSEGLQATFPDGELVPKIIAVEPKATLEEMRFLVDDPDVGAVILDQKLKDTGVATYFGIELASYLRSINAKIPIYILTTDSEAEDLDEGKINIEEVFDKQKFPRSRAIFGARILRHINTYIDIQSDRFRRFEELLRKSIREPLSDGEAKEYEQLSHIRSKQYLLDEAISEESLRKLAEIEEKIGNIEKGLRLK